MKMLNYKSILTTVLFSLMGVVQIFAERKPPSPRGSGGFDGGVVVGGPIDDYLQLLFFMAIVLGAYLHKKYQLSANH